MIWRNLKTLAQRVEHGLRYDPFDLAPAAVRFVRFVGRRAALASENRQVEATPGYIEHYGVHMPRNNAGDTVLFDAVERLFDDQLGPFRWRLSQLRATVTKADVDRVNGMAKAVLVGGGGLFIADTNRNSDSGWQWKISVDNLKHIEPPLILFAVGYNTFRNGEPFSPVFEQHLAETVRKSSFIGMRNSGSIVEVKRHLPKELHDRVTFQPCMTTVLKYFYPEARRHERMAKDIAVNLAFDRRDKRFGNNEGFILDSIAKALRHAISKGYRLHAAVHAWDDDPMIEFFRREGIPVNIRRLNLDSPADVVSFYAGMPLTIGMRGHAQMIPFGCGNAIFSIISHEKMRYFLEDIGQPDWGADVADAKLADRITAFIDGFEAAKSTIRSSIDNKQRELWSITQANLQVIGKYIFNNDRA